MGSPRSLVVLIAMVGCGRSHFDAQAQIDAPPGDGISADALPTPVVRYAMDNNPSGNSVPASDAAYSTTCVPHCPTPTAGHLAGGYHFDGTGGFSIPTSSLVGRGPYTIGLWIKAQSGAPDDMCTVTKTFSATGDFDVFNIVIKTSGMLDYETTDGVDYSYASAGVIDILDAWHHVAATFDGTTKRIYVDGVVRGAQTSTTLNSVEPMFVGVDYDYGAPANTNNYVGDMDELEIYARALTDQEVAATATR